MKEKYISTRGKEQNMTASQSIIKGLAKDGGLYVPSFIHDIKLNLNELSTMDYKNLAKAIFTEFLDDFSEAQIDACVNGAYATGKFKDSEPVAVQKVGNRFFLELFHGPTSAFKDMALTILPYFMTTSIENANLQEEIIILTATSGDTGKAALAGFSNVPKINIMVYYPKDGVSTIQEKQMLTQEGDNTCVIGVDGNFDHAQNGVKAIFSDHAFATQLKEQGFSLSSANSINIGRLLPQVIYYFYSYFQLVKSNEIQLGDKVNFVVPTGNFGNILAGHYAQILGLPIHQLICASNSNNVLTDFIKTGEYNKNRDFHKTISPSMDILISSNLERLLMSLSGDDATLINDLMTNLNETGSYTISKDLQDKICDTFKAGYANEEETAKAIHDCFLNESYLMDPHTAVADKVYQDYVKETGDTTPSIILSTASPYKFGHSVYESIFGNIPEGMDDYQVLVALSEKTNTEIPLPLRDLDKKANLHFGTCTPSEMPQTITDFISKKEGK